MSTYARRWKFALVLCLVFTLLTACTAGDKSDLPELPKDGSGKVRLLYWSEEQFMNDYGNNFNVKYPEIEFEIVPTSEIYQGLKPGDDYEKKFKEFIKSKNLDMVVLRQQQYEQLADEGILYNLDSIIQSEKYPLDDFHPGVIDFLRELGGNALYGLSPNFESTVLFYNADLFKEYGVEPPRHKMAVQEFIELAKRFESKSNKDDERIYGFHSEHMPPSQVLFYLAQMSNLQIVDPKAEKIVMDSEAWRSIFVGYVDLMKDKKTNVMDPNNNRILGQGFAQGKAAMTFGDIWMLEQVQNPERYRQNDKKIKSFEWNMVTVPVDPAKPDESSMIQLGEVFAIMNDSPNKRAAWELLKFTNGPEMARINGKSSRKLTTRTKYQKDIGGKNMDAFTLLKPGTSARSMYMTLFENKVADDFLQELFKKIEESIKTAVDGKKSADQAYTDLLPELQQLLEASKKKGAEERAKAEQKK